MFGIGGPELLLICILALILLGPEQLPKVVSFMGRWLGQARKTADEFKRQLNLDAPLSEIEELKTDLKSRLELPKIPIDDKK
ncbi:MAG: Sec-independent protein translocase protein TatB [Deltaproteobacteria bacterium]|jgi:Tat protein translocase TatB subunit|nr:Sec-independent protein translocase protein TatB [Deltaproteobacteria bacterium]